MSEVMDSDVWQSSLFDSLILYNVNDGRAYLFRSVKDKPVHRKVFILFLFGFQLIQESDRNAIQRYSSFRVLGL
jgi:hypothetical protein